MAHKTLISGTAYDVTGGKCLVGGTGYSIQKGRTLVNGTGYDIAFESGVELSTFSEGSLVKLNESGSPVEFYVAKHDYESGLNGSGRTLVVRKDCYDSRVFSNSNNAFSGSAIDTWLNGTYLKLLDSDIQTAIGTTKFYYTPGNGSNSVTTLSRAVFLLSVTELGGTVSYANTEGSALPIASTLQIAYCNGSACVQWTRTPHTSIFYRVFYLGTDGNVGSDGYNSRSHGSRPAFTLPSTALFGSNSHEFVG